MDEIVRWIERTARALSPEGGFGEVKAQVTEAGLYCEIHMATRKGAGVVIGKGGDTIASIRSLASKMAMGLTPPLHVEIRVANVDGALAAPTYDAYERRG